MIEKIVRDTIRAYNEIAKEIKDKDVQIAVLNEVMTTYRTILINERYGAKEVMEERKEEHKELMTDAQYQFLTKYLIDEDELRKLVREEYGLESPRMLTKAEASKLIDRLKKDKGW